MYNNPINIKYFFLLFTILTGSFSHSFSQHNIIVYENSNNLLDVSSQIQILEDKTGTINFDEISSKKFISVKGDVANLGITKSIFWIKIPVKNLSDKDNLLLELSLPILDYIEFYYEKDNEYTKYEVGEEFVFSSRKYKDPYFFFDINIPTGKTKIFYLKVRSSEGIQLPIKIGTKTVFDSKIKIRDILSGLYIGLMIVMILYNLFVYITVKDRSYIYYVIYIISILFTQISLQGYTFQYLWPNKPLIANYSLFILPCISGVTGMIFMNHFLKVKKYLKLFFKISIFLSLMYLIPITLAFFKIFDWSHKIMEINAMIVSLFMLITGILIFKKGFKPAKYFIIAWVIFLLGVIVFVLKDAGVLPFNNFTRYTMQIGSGVETILLSFALAARINIYKKERLEAVEEKERLVREQNVILEQTVEQRTAKLNNTLTELKKAQSQLVEAEKMSSLGQLTAGIAHEINNPINFVSSNITPLRNDIEDLKTILNKYEEVAQKENLEIAIEEVEALKKELDYDYLKEELNIIINGIEDGAKRTTEIVSGLRNFSRLDESEFKVCNINEGIESTLVLIKNKINGIKVELNLADIAECECNPGKINQLIMNLIDNSIYAINKKHDNVADGLIKISTVKNEEYINIAIEDNGIGISDENLSKLYDPFFTTKDVGEGTGLGLSIVKGIVESHEGTIEINSTVNRGTTIIVKIPINKN